jgi:hypothetical protein
MSKESEKSCPTRNHNIHHQIKEISDSLRPHLVRLHECPSDKCGDAALYTSIIQKLDVINHQVTNHDCHCAMQNAVAHLEKAVDLTRNSALNEEILWQLQEVMALLFKIQNLPI